MSRLAALLRRCRDHLLSRNFLSSWAVLGLALLCLAAAGYHLMYHASLVGVGIEHLAGDRKDAPFIAMKYEGVQWFRARRVTPTAPIEIETYGLPQLDWERGTAAGLELFIQLEGLDGVAVDEDDIVATLQIEQRPEPERVAEESHPLRGMRQQRVHSTWVTFTPNHDDLNRVDGTAPNVMEISLDVPDGSPVTGALIGTRIHANLHRFAIKWAVAGAFLLVVWASSGRRWRRVDFWLLVGTLLVMLAFRAGAFISNDLFHDTSSSATTFKTCFSHLRMFVGLGEWSPHLYKQPGHFLFPALVMAVEPWSLLMPTAHYVETYPLPRYASFLVEASGVLVLTLALYRHLAPKAAFVFPFVYATFPPILFDVYDVEEDGMLVLAMLFLTALLLRMARRATIEWRDIRLCTLIVFIMLICKVTTLFLVPLIPTALVLARRKAPRGPALRKAAALFGALVAAFVGARGLTKVVGPATREAQPGFAYQRHMLWDMLWAANGLYDYDTAHPFAKAGRFRDRAVAERAAAAAGSTVEAMFPEGIDRLRHSAIGDELVFRPDLTNAWNERPAFFLNTAVRRHWGYGMLFYGYPSRGQYWRLDQPAKRPRFSLWDEPGHDATAARDAMGRQGGRTLSMRARLDDVWKIGPLVYVLSLFNLDQPEDRTISVLLTMLAITGIICMRRADLAIIFITGVAAKIVFNTFIHGRVRYFDWVHVPMLVGLALIIAIALSACWECAKRLGVQRDGTERSGVSELHDDTD